MMLDSGLITFVVLAIFFPLVCWVLPRLFGKSAMPVNWPVSEVTLAEPVKKKNVQTGGLARLLIWFGTLFPFILLMVLLAVYTLVHAHVDVFHGVWVAIALMLIVFVLYVRPLKLLQTELLDNE